MSTTPQTNKQSITLAMLRKLIQDLPPAKLARLPVDRLPDHIPEDLVEEAPFYSRNALEGLIMEANAYHLSLRMRLQQAIGDEGINALDSSHHAGTTANIRVFRNKLLELISLRQDIARGDRRPDFSLLAANIKRMNDLLIDVRTEQLDSIRSRDLLRKLTPREEVLQKPVDHAIKRLSQAINSTNQLLGQFFTLRLQLARLEMSRKRTQVESLQEKRETIRLEMQKLSKELQSTTGFLQRTLHRRQTQAQQNKIQTRIIHLASELKNADVPISETDLTLWLDTIVDASLHPQAREFVRELLSQARTALYYLLNQYCMMQEYSAKQIASNPFLQIDPQGAIRYVLKSEEFILLYFARKREQATAWLSNAAQIRMEDLDELEKDLVQALRKSARLIG
ncbi:hypothetical protein [Acidihalobacter prosperus]